MNNLLLATSIEQAINKANQAMQQAESGFYLGVISLVLIFLTMFIRFIIRGDMRQDYNDKIVNINKQLQEQNIMLKNEIELLKEEYHQVLEEVKQKSQSEIKQLKDENAVLGIKLDSLKETTFLFLANSDKNTKKSQK